MYSNNYAKEVGLRTEVKTVPLKFALPILAATMAGIWFGVVQPDVAARTAKANGKSYPPASWPAQTVAQR